MTPSQPPSAPLQPDQPTPRLRAQRNELPQPSPEALAHCERLCAHIRDAITTAGGWIPFSQYMELALYAPGLGYYSAGARKLGAEGDFTTAPEMSPLFGQVLAQQVRDLFAEDGLPRAILEVGAGSGSLAASLLEELERLDATPDDYFILELSADLRQRERDTLAERVPALLPRVTWLNQLPPSFSGVIIGNEVLDAMPVELVRSSGDSSSDSSGAHGVEQGGVCWSTDANAFALKWRPATIELADNVHALAAPALAVPGYQSEIGLAASAFITSIASMLYHGAAIFFDYGFPRAEFYHPQRTEGTLMCHYRHRAHGDPLFLPGLQDITAHVDFSAIAAAGHAAGLEVLGYTSQSHFLINCGITELLSRVDPDDLRAYLPLAGAAQHLLSPAEMGELFKVIALGRGIREPLAGFSRGDRIDTL